MRYADCFCLLLFYLYKERKKEGDATVYLFCLCAPDKSPEQRLGMGTTAVVEITGKAIILRLACVRCVGD